LEHSSENRSLTRLTAVSDASIASVIEHADYLLIGCDKCLQDGSVSNKIGSLPAAVLAKTLNPGCRVVAVIETSKIAHSDFNSGHSKTEYNDDAEVVTAWPVKLLSDLEEKRSLGFQLEVKNAYFEWVPARYIDTYISERGFLNSGDIAKLSADSFDLEKRLFGDL
jgi:translation initiation factor 2B subunit (eIF-2B alpha/beta/delta family)